MTRRLSLLVPLAAVAAFTAYLHAQGTPAGDVRADYERANGLRARVTNKVYDAPDAPTWAADSTAFWYRKSVKGGNQFVRVDPKAGTKTPAFDHARLAAGINAVVGGDATALTLPFTTFTYTAGASAVDFTIGGGRAGGGALTRLECSLSDYTCRRAGTSNAGAGPGRAGGGRTGGPAANAAPQFKASPDGKTEAFIQNFNVWVRPAGNRADDAAVALSFDGSEGNFYTYQSLQWSPDSRRLAGFRRVPGYQRQLTFVQSSPSDQLQPKVSSRTYRKPGDVVDIDTPVLFDVAARTARVVDNALFPNPYSLQRIEWRQDSRAFTFEYNQRGHQTYRVIEVDGATAAPRVVIDETSTTFVDYRRTSTGLADSGRTERIDLADGKEIIWMSERDGWAHLYLYDGATGRVKQQITKGPWAVHHVERVDEPNRQIYFTANGMDAHGAAPDGRPTGTDPYFLKTYRINFDGTGLVTYTPAPAQHTVTWSPDHAFYVDTYSRVDLPPVSELRRAADQSVVMELERADATELMATGWKAPEVFVSKARDGVTDIWGVIVRPTNFDPSKKYPVIENIYAGPQGSFVPKTFSTQTGMQTLAELGFIVVQIDGMGTANRSKAFHEVAWKNLQDAGFPDRILWHKAVAARYPSYDITRVGIYGTSAGGQNSTGAVLFHPEFYKAAASSAGCHDNRMDKIWWNEQWMGWPLGPEYAAASNTEHAKNLQGALLLIVGEMDTNVDPASTMQVVNQLILANKNFDLLVIPNADHTSGGAYGDHKRFDFFVRHLRGLEPPTWNTAPPPATPGATMDYGVSVLDEDAAPWVASEDWGLGRG
jgi:dipeptidyl aminopeptidase/acylaminoacyl peptidase